MVQQRIVTDPIVEAVMYDGLSTSGPRLVYSAEGAKADITNGLVGEINADPDSPFRKPAVSSNPKRAFGKRKPGIHYIPPVAILEEAVVMAGGADKYTAYNWQDEPVDASTYYDAIFRHLTSWFTGEDRDDESKASHLAHVRACCGILMDAQASGKLIDDRPQTASAAAAIKRLTATDAPPVPQL